MSLQTGREISPLDSKRLVDRVRHRLALIVYEPNPIWIRELKQSARLTRTPIVLMALSLLMTLVVASLGGTMSSQEPADKIGVTLFHTYFSIAFFVVTLVGPALAANAVASEREGKTWDAILLTGLAPERIARGKFLAAFTAISTYIVMLAPVGALSFLFGGITATEVAIAFVYLFLVAAVFVSLGLAISAKLQTLRASIVITLLLAVPLAGMLYTFFGWGAAEGIHSLWPRVPGKLPIWLPTAYLRGDFGVLYVLFLFAIPFVSIFVSTWFCYESTVANLRDDNDDRGFGLKRWYLVSVPLFAGTALFAQLSLDTAHAEPIAAVGAVALGMFLVFAALVFVGEPAGPSRRVRAAWGRQKPSPIRTLLGPSVANTGVLQLLLGALAILAVGGVGVMRIDSDPRPFQRTAEGFGYFVSYEIAFFVFIVGFSVWLRARSSSPAIARVLLIVTIAGACILPWVLAAVLGVVSRDESGLLVASPSPFFAVVMYQAVNDAGQSDKIVAGVACLGAWAVLGIGFLLTGGARSKRLRDESDRAALRADALLAAEDGPREDTADVSTSLA